jgi:peptidoglycan/LPS O-acetylase OafA/YrhL
MENHGRHTNQEPVDEPTISVGRSGAHAYIPALDGVRGIAVITVILHHHQLLNMGWMGVDLFFVLSGYLITTILRGGRSGKNYWRSFWVKRVTRILPAFLLLLVFAIALGFRPTWLDLSAYLFTMGDLMAYLRPHNEVIAPVWSLAVEEHFYMLWPFAVCYLPKRTLLYLLGALIVFEPAVRAVTSLFTHNWAVFYYLTPFRLDGLGFGCMLALLLESPRLGRLIHKWSGPGVLMSIGMLLTFRMVLGVSYTFSGSTMTYNSSVYFLVACVSVCMIAYLLQHPASLPGRIAAWKPLVFLGTVSYGIYLYNALIEDATKRLFGFSDHKAIWIDTFLTVMLAWISYELYERPLIVWGRRLARAKETLPHEVAQ